MSFTQTTNYLWSKPDFDHKGWYTLYNANFDSLDTLLGTYGFTTSGPATIKKLSIPVTSTLTIASDAITVTGSHHQVDTEGAAATDNLATINGGSAGQLLILRTVSAARDVTIVDNNNAGGNNIRLVGNVNFTLTDTDDLIVLFTPTGSVWYEIARLDIS